MDVDGAYVIAGISVCIGNSSTSTNPNSSFVKAGNIVDQMEKEEYYEKTYADGEWEIKEMIVVGILASGIQTEKKDYQTIRTAVAGKYVILNFSIDGMENSNNLKKN